jgi:hypothetical protein
MESLGAYSAKNDKESFLSFFKDKKLDDYEVEARILNIDETRFNNIIFTLENIKNITKEEENTRVYLYDKSNVRKVVNLDKKEEYYEDKKTFFYYFDNSKELKYSISKEKIIDSFNEKGEKVKMIRERNRKKFIFGDYAFVDCTLIKVLNVEDENIEETKFEVEIENNSKNSNLDKFYSFIDSFIKKINTSEDTVAINFLNKVLSGDTQTKENKNILTAFISKPRDIKLADLTDDGILCLSLKEEKEKRGFTVSVKADGIQYFLIIYNGDIFLSNSQKTIKLNEKKFDPLSPSFDSFKEINFSVFPGELIEGNRFLPFDCLCFRQSIIKNKDYLTRYSFVEKLLEKKDIIKELTFLVLTKKSIYLLGKNSNSFYSGMKECKDEYHDYETDGYIFTPISSPYLCEGQNKDIKERKLSKYLDVCKYKPLERMSIDFYVDKEGKLCSLFSGGKKSRNIVFTGSKQNPFDYKKNVSYDRDEKKKEDVKGKIYEFQYYKKEDNTIYLEPTRERKDKFYPNKLEVANDDWNIMNNPILESTLLGEDMTLLRRYHNDIKREIFGWIPEISQSEILKEEKSYLLDIGGGNGGDIDKWIQTPLEQVLSFEPNETFYDEFNRRLKLKGIEESKHYIKVCLGYGQEKDKILKECKEFFDFNNPSPKKTLYISFMISLSFFFKETQDGEKEEYKKLGDTILAVKEYFDTMTNAGEVIILFFTIDGYKLENYFKEYKSGKLELNTVTLKKKGDEIFVDIKDSKTVFSQTEYLVKIDLFFKYINFVFIDQKYCNDRELLSSAEKIYSSFFSYGYASSRKDRLSNIRGMKFEMPDHPKNRDKIGKENPIRICVPTLNSFNHSVLYLTDKNYMKISDEEKDIMAARVIFFPNFTINIYDYLYNLIDKMKSDKTKKMIRICKIGEVYEPIILE